MGSRQFLPVLAVALTLAGCQPAADTELSEQDMATLRGMIDGYVTHVRAQDWNALVAYYTDDAVRMPPNEPMQEGKGAILAWLEGLPPVTEFTVSPQIIDGQGDLAYARGTYTLDLAPPDSDPVSSVGKWHAIYERQADGSWLCVSDIWNTDQPAAM